MYEARLHDPVHGSAVKIADTPEQAVELAFRELASRWMHPDDAASWSEDAEMFDGEIRGIEVWWHNRAWGLLGTVTKV